MCLCVACIVCLSHYPTTMRIGTRLAGAEKRIRDRRDADFRSSGMWCLRMWFLIIICYRTIVTSISIYIHIYIYIERERERGRDTYIYIYIYIHVCITIIIIIIIIVAAPGWGSTPSPPTKRLPTKSP